MANRAPTLLATALAAACSLSAQAEAPSQADFAKVVLYSNVTIAQDSANSWGIWEELEPPAAGPQAPLPQLAGAVDPYRPLGNVTPTTLVTPTTPVTPQPSVPLCVSGAMCGFGVITSRTESYTMEQPQAVSSEAPLERMGFQLLATITQPNEDANRWQPQALLVNLQGVRSDVTAPTGFVGLGPLEQERTDMGFVHSHQSFKEGSSYTEVRIATDTSDPGVDAVGRMLGDVVISRYVSGVNNAPGTINSQISSVYGIWGITTSVQEMDALRMSNAQATYSGKTFNADGASTGGVFMSVNFGSSTFTADFNGGVNVQNPLANGTLQATAAGTTQVNGALSFRASGTISGSLFSANALQIAGANNSITGKVEGAFFGSNAAVAAGVADVTAKIQNSANEAAITARYATPFVATKDVPNVQPK